MRTEQKKEMKNMLLFLLGCIFFSVLSNDVNVIGAGLVISITTELIIHVLFGLVVFTLVEILTGLIQLLVRYLVNKYG